VVTKAGSKSTTGRRRTPGRSAAIGIADALADISDLKTAQDVGTRVEAERRVIEMERKRFYRTGPTCPGRTWPPGPTSRTT
jgi:hypothetical protein